MSRLFACIISPDIERNREALIAAAREFSYLIETLDDGILFNVSGLERLIGKPDAVAAKILETLRQQDIAGSVAVADTVDSACLLARQNRGANTVNLPEIFPKLPLFDLPIRQDTLNVLSDLGIHKIEDLLAVPREDLIGRYGDDFRKVIDVIEQKGASMLTPNIKQSCTSWAFEPDSAVENFEQLIFLINHGLEKLFTGMSAYGLSTEHLDISFKLKNKTVRAYEIKTSFPTLERPFWLKLIHLRISIDPPEAGIISVCVTSHFTKPRPSQRGLYAVSRPEAESLVLTIGKLKKLVGEGNVGVPVILNERSAEPFRLDDEALPVGIERPGKTEPGLSVIAFTYYRPPQPAEVVYRDGRLIFIRTKSFEGHVCEYSGVWKGSSTWWDRPWITQEWDIEVEDRGVYRLCRAGRDWFLAGEYD